MLCIISVYRSIVLNRSTAGEKTKKGFMLSFFFFFVALHMRITLLVKACTSATWLPFNVLIHIYREILIFVMCHIPKLLNTKKLILGRTF